MKKNILIFLLGVLTTSIVGVTASYLYQANEISYNDTTVENALNELYTRTEDYVELTSDTTVTPQSLLNGITAYNKNGELITGNINTDCVNGKRVWTSSDTTNGYLLSNFVPSYYYIYSEAGNVEYFWYYIKDIDPTHRVRIYKSKNSNDATATFEKQDLVSSAFMYDNNFKIKFSSGFEGKTIYYTVCK